MRVAYSVAVPCFLFHRAARVHADATNSYFLSGALQVLRRPLSYAIVDEVDSVLIDNCRNPLLIAAPPIDVQEERQLANEVRDTWSRPMAQPY